VPHWNRFNVVREKRRSASWYEKILIVLIAGVMSSMASMMAVVQVIGDNQGAWFIANSVASPLTKNPDLVGLVYVGIIIMTAMPGMVMAVQVMREPKKPKD
jgi:hypothetical protein